MENWIQIRNIFLKLAKKSGPIPYLYKFQPEDPDPYLSVTWQCGVTLHEGMCTQVKLGQALSQFNLTQVAVLI